MTESVWDYPRPPRVEPSTEHVVVQHGGVVLADTTASLRVLETSHPPTYYLPLDAFADGVLRPGEGASWCEWKGQAAYLDLVEGIIRTGSLSERIRAALLPYSDQDDETFTEAARLVYIELADSLEGNEPCPGRGI